MLALWLIIMLFIAIGIFLLSLSVDLKTLYSNVKKGIQFTTNTIDKTIETSKSSKIGKLIELTDEMILSSNIKLYIPYNVLIHFLICTLTATLAYLWISQYMNVIISLIFALLGLIIPFSILKLITNFMNARLQRHSIDFLIILKNFFMATGDIFVALDKTKDYSIEPIRTYIDIMIYEYKHKINPFVCFDNLINKIGYHELKLFFQNLKIAYLHGSDILALIDEFINEINNLNEDSDKEDTEDFILNLGLYVLLLINFLVIYYVLNSQYKFEITNTLYGQVVFIADILASFYILYITLDKGY